MSAKHIAQWGNSLAMRITKEEAEELGWERDTPIKVSIIDGKLVAETVSSTEHPRAGWAEQMQSMAKQGDDALLDTVSNATSWDEQEWVW